MSFILIFQVYFANKRFYQQSTIAEYRIVALLLQIEKRIETNSWLSENSVKNGSIERKDERKKHKPTNVGRIALERQARQFNSRTVA